jgi:hypothetical protein
MATTSLWSVKGYLGNLVIYVENPDKTTNPKTFEQKAATEQSRQSLEDVIAYASRDDATHSQQLVSGVNCYPITARDEMMLIKERFGKTGGVIAYHGYQSFKPGETSPEQANEIGVKLAERCWGDNYQVIVATHCDKDHTHNHFLINTVGFKDGIKFHRTKADYAKMREQSDILCAQYGLSINGKPAIDHANECFINDGQKPVSASLHHGEWRARKDGKLTGKDLIKHDLDVAISRSIDWEQVFLYLRKNGYEVKMGKELSVKAPSRECFLRPARHFGEDYSKDGITARLQHNHDHYREQLKYYKPKQSEFNQVSQQLRGKPKDALYTVYQHYALVINLYAKAPFIAAVAPTMRAEAAATGAILRQAYLLLENLIDTVFSLIEFKLKTQAKIDPLIKERNCLYKTINRTSNPEKITDCRQRLKDINMEIKPLRLAVKDCDTVIEREPQLKQRIKVLEPRNNERNR